MKFEDTKVMGIEMALRGLRLPLCKNYEEAKEKSDSYILYCNSEPDLSTECIGNDDMRVAQNRCKADSAFCGQPESKFLRMIHCQFCLTAPVVFFQEIDTYKVGVTRNSSSLQHTGMKRDFLLDDFELDEKKVNLTTFSYWLEQVNDLRRKYVETKDYRYFVAMRSMIPMSYKYTSMIDLNYEVLRNIYSQRKHHRLPYWHEFCEFIKTLPYSKELITDGE